MISTGAVGWRGIEESWSGHLIGKLLAGFGCLPERTAADASVAGLAAAA